MRLPRHAEPLVTEAVESEVDSYATRQMRRRARRAEAKAGRSRRPATTLYEAAKPQEEAALAVATVEVPVEASVASPIETSPQPVTEAAVPLPSNRALVRRPSGLIDRLFGGWLLRRPAKVARCDPNTLTGQMLVLRTELALVQSRLDKIIAATESG
jgi:hypothetical protein